MQKIQKPAAGEYKDYSAAYISKVPDDGMVLQYLQTDFETIRTLVMDLPEEKLLSAYAPGKWTLKEILVHMMDTERIFAYRALRIARNDKTDLPGFEQDEYTPYLYANERSIANIMEEYGLQRKSTVALFSNFDESAFTRTGFANGAPLSVRAALYIIAGHELHHLQIIREKYL
ncbi:DinB family protein [Ilyomonas limi]|uniref:DinB family protein n=1 Tax=Ilyomonas limi TaxID=2575867 RepID=A0A4U3L8S5_9BACT|nr:DinB family protein [Ilyomonas limi]TKK71462.1 DinB family protein [Ilyomonas limi]